MYTQNFTLNVLDIPTEIRSVEHGENVTFKIRPKNSTKSLSFFINKRTKEITVEGRIIGKMKTTTTNHILSGGKGKRKKNNNIVEIKSVSNDDYDFLKRIERSTIKEVQKSKPNAKKCYDKIVKSSKRSSSSSKKRSVEKLRIKKSLMRLGNEVKLKELSVLRHNHISWGTFWNSMKWILCTITICSTLYFTGALITEIFTKIETTAFYAAVYSGTNAVAKIAAIGAAAFGVF